MTYGLLMRILEENRIPEDTILMTDSGWECDATNANGVFYNPETKCIVLTQGGIFYNKEYIVKPWQALYIDEEE